MVTFMAPVAVAAEFPDDPEAYSKVPFGILGTGIQLIGKIVSDLDPIIGDFAPIDLAPIVDVTDSVGYWTGVNLAWMTDMTGWSMVAVGDVLTVITPLADLFDAGQYIKPVADVFYVLGARVFDNWDDISTEIIAPLPGPGIGLPVWTP